MHVSAGHQGYEPSPEMSKALQALKGLVEVAKQEEAKQPSATKAIPKVLNPGLTQFACVLAIESTARPAAKDFILDQVSYLPSNNPHNTWDEMDFAVTGLSGMLGCV